MTDGAEPPTDGISIDDPEVLRELTEPVVIPRASADWVSNHDLAEMEKGTLTAEDLLRRECEQRGEEPPSAEERAIFAADVARHQEEARARAYRMARAVAPLGAKLGETLANTAELGRRLGMPPADLGTLKPLPNPAIYTTEAIRDLEDALVAEQRMTVAILNRMVTNAERVERRNLVAVAVTATIAMATLVVAILTLVRP